MFVGGLVGGFVGDAGVGKSVGSVVVGTAVVGDAIGLDDTPLVGSRRCKKASAQLSELQLSVFGRAVGAFVPHKLWEGLLVD